MEENCQHITSDQNPDEKFNRVIVFPGYSRICAGSDSQISEVLLRTYMIRNFCVALILIMKAEQ